MQLVCISCGVLAFRDGGQAKRCLPCASKSRPRIATHGRRNSAFLVSMSPTMRKEFRRLARFAHSEVSKAVRLGLLRPATACDCADCGKPAEQYDHRSYLKPLEVDPVCRSCNQVRGPAAIEA